MNCRLQYISQKYFPGELQQNTGGRIAKLGCASGRNSKSSYRTPLDFKWLASTSCVSRAAFMLLEVVALDAASQVSGVGVILDLKGFSWRHLAHYDLTLARAIIRTIQDTLPIRFKGSQSC